MKMNDEDFTEEDLSLDVSIPTRGRSLWEMKEQDGGRIDGISV